MNIYVHSGFKLKALGESGPAIKAQIFGSSILKTKNITRVHF
jgi:hypothetical protein